MEKIKPTKKQLDFLNWEIGVFFHFGIRSFNEGHKDWDGKHMELSTFNPTELDCEQWIKTIKAGGAKYAILTTKHHDGFANWPSKYTEYSVKNTPWKNGQGDVVREFTDACRKHNIKVGLYYSPAQFGYTQMSGDEYDDYFINQISELLTDYGKIDYLWFDGCGSEGHEYNKDRIIAAIRGLQPDILIFSMWDPDTRWVGNEEGITPDGTRYTVDNAATSINDTVGDSYSDWKFLPYECDCKIRRYNWFYSENDEKYLRSLDDLMGLYDCSVGRGGNLLLNIAPDRRGLLPQKDSERFIEFGNAIKEQFANPLDVHIKQKENVFEVSFDGQVNVKTVVIEESLEEGESVNEFEIYIAFIHPDDPHEVLIYRGKEIGNRRIIRIPSTYMDENFILRVKITDSNGSFAIKSIKLYE